MNDGYTKKKRSETRLERNITNENCKMIKTVRRNQPRRHITLDLYEDSLLATSSQRFGCIALLMIECLNSGSIEFAVKCTKKKEMRT